VRYEDFVFHPAQLCRLLFDFVINASEAASYRRNSVSFEDGVRKNVTVEMEYAQWRDVAQIQVSSDVRSVGILHCICDCIRLCGTGGGGMYVCTA